MITNCPYARACRYTTCKPADCTVAATDPTEQPINHPLLGKRVRVVLDHVGFAPDTGPTAVTGTLTRLDTGGEAGVRTDDGRITYCWPALTVTEETP
jgi:hypothetical protein